MNERHVKKSLAVLQNLFPSQDVGNFAVRLWNGALWQSVPGCPASFTLVLRHAGALRAMLWPPNEISIGEAYIYDDIDVEGDFAAFFAFLKNLRAVKRSISERLGMAIRLLSLPSARRPRAGRQAPKLTGTKHSKERDQQAVRYHYDVSNDFFALWLDSQMVYSCAYFISPEDDLDTAQKQKVDYICRKLRLQRGERLLDIGCGWGGLVIHACKHYGAEAVGITLSQRQVELANQRIREAGLAGRCRVEPLDYRDIEPPESFDKVVSVGMFEHVGKAMLPTFFQKAWRLLRPGGVFLNHGIALGKPRPPGRTSFSRRYVFPDGELVLLGTSLQIAEPIGFEIRDVESLREHYTLTLSHWLKRLEARHEEVRLCTDETTYRIWRIYMAGAADGFRTGLYNIYQTIFVKPNHGQSGLPLTRADWYLEKKGLIPAAGRT